MRIGFVTDEISADVEEALELGVSWGIYDFELRMLGERRVPQIEVGDIQRILVLQRKHGLRITALSPGVFKGTIHDEGRLRHELQEILPQTFQLARLFNSPTVLVFGFQRAAHDKPDDEKKIIAAFHHAAIAARQHGLRLAIENEPGFWCDTGANTARLLGRIASPRLRANWDPANVIGTNETPFPNGYEAIKSWISNVHVKDTRLGALIECVPVGEGRVDWRGQLQTLARDNLVKHITIETHCPPLRENSKKNLETVRALLAFAPDEV